jgi:nitroreductase
MDLREAIYTRRSVREYLEKPVDQEILVELVDAAIRAPSAVNQQPCSFSIVRNRSLLDDISRKAKAHMVRVTPLALMSHHFQQILNDPDFDIFYHAPALIVISTTSDIPWAVEDCALAAENLMLAARAIGLGSCWIGFSQSWLATSDGKAALKIPATYKPVAPIIVGYPKSFPLPVQRKEPEIRWL